MAGGERFWREMAEGSEHKAGVTLLKAMLWPFSLVYANIMRLRALAYRHGALRVNRLPRPVIAVGNLTVGGTGKTPMVALLCRDLMERGKRVTVLSRGYSGTVRKEPRIVSDGRTLFLSPAEAGDEPYMLAAAIPGLAVVIGSDRYRAGLFALEHLAQDIFILDDGFQHLCLWRDLNILLLDSSSPFGNGLTLPAGLLREPAGAMKRADLVVLTRCDKETPPLSLGGPPLCRAAHRLTGVTPIGGGALEPFAALAGKRGIAFAGIADPSGFFDALRSTGVNLVAGLPLPDHCSYGEKELAAICRERDIKNADFLITTAKDGVKLAPHLAKLGGTYVAHLDMRMLDPEPLQAAIEKLLQKQG
jgi:tetraacyldisaccharide 4'-kinase